MPCGRPVVGKDCRLDARQAINMFVPCLVSLSLSSYRWMAENKGTLFEYIRSQKGVRRTHNDTVL